MSVADIDSLDWSPPKVTFTPSEARVRDYDTGAVLLRRLFFRVGRARRLITFERQYQPDGTPAGPWKCNRCHS